MQAVVLAGGEGVRLRPLTERTPKPLLPVMGRPLVAHLLDRLPRQVDTVVLAVSYRADDVRAWVKRADDPALDGRDVVVVEERVPLGTAGAIANCVERIDGTCLVLNGDLVSDVDLDALLARHEATGALATIALYEVDDPSRFGVVDQRPDGRVVRFVEKPPRADAPSRRVNAGAYVLDPAVLDMIPRGRPVSIEREVFPQVCATPRGLFGLIFEGLWIDCGTPESYLGVHRALLARDGRSRWLGAETEVPPDAVADGSWLGAHVVLGPQALVLGCVVHDDVRIGARARLEDSVVGAGARIGAGAVLRRTVVGTGAEVPAGADLVDARVAPRHDGADL